MESRDLKDRYVNPYTDFGFKKLFGTEINKDLLISFINSLLHGREVVKDLTYLNTEHLGTSEADRRAVFDVYCENEKGEKFIVEMQNASQQYFKDRSLYYATFPIREQAQKGAEWNYELKHVYVVALLNYNMSKPAFAKDTINHDVGLLDKQTHRVFNDKLTFKYVEISKFDKRIEELKTNYDKWLFVLQNLSRLNSQPKYLQTAVFTRLFKQAEIAGFTRTELREYEDSLKAFRDLRNTLDNAKQEGRAEGRAEGEKDKAIEIAKNLLEMGMPIDAIMKATGLSSEEVRNI